MERVTPELLQSVQLFDGLSESLCSELIPYFEQMVYPKGESLFQQGQRREKLFLILDGEVQIIDDSLGWEKIVVTAGPGSVLGESILLEKTSHALECRARTAISIAVLTVETILRIEQENPTLSMGLLRAVGLLMSRRVANASRGDRGMSMASMSDKYRTEHDLLGERSVPAKALWGVQTLRAVENFPITGVRLDHFPDLIEALAATKWACAQANAELGLLERDKADLILRACDELWRGMWHGHFVVDMIQGGAGTSTNMNANEVIANRALELMGEKKANYDLIHPNSHVNMSQSTNDVYPSAVKIALLSAIMKPASGTSSFIDEVELLADAFHRKGREFANVLKMGRTQLQDAVPMSLGQEFDAWGRNIREGGQRIRAALTSLYELNMGGTAIGTGINTDPRYATLVISHLRKKTGLDVHLAEDLVESTQDTSGFVELAGVFKMFAVRLSKICNDLRLLSSGPRCGLGEINLPAVQPGSSIMPGKVNPVIPEVVNQVAFQVIGLDTAVAMCAEGGQLELNVFEPLLAYNLFSSIGMLRNAMSTLRLRCVDGITANVEHCRDMVYNSIGIVTALNPYLGYEKTSTVAKTALKTGKPVRELVLEFGFMSEEEVDRILDPEQMIRPTLNNRR